MVGFREENRFLIFSACAFGLYMPSNETLIRNKCLKTVLRVWTKIPIILICIYFSMDVRGMLVDEMLPMVRFAMLRKVVVSSGFVLKNISFYWNRHRFEKLIDLWDASFKEEFFPQKNLAHKIKNRRENKRLVTAAILLAMTASLSYTFPSYFNKKKVIKHPSGLIYPHRSPEFELAVTFDVGVGVLCVSAPLFDCIFMVFLSHIRYKLNFLREVLADIINEIIIDKEGRLMGRRTDSQTVLSKADYPERVLPSGEDQTDSSQQPEEIYEEVDPKGSRFREHVANIESQLRIWVLHHQQAILFFEQVSKVYATVATFQLGYIVVYTAMTAVNMVQMKLSIIVLGTILIASSNLLALFMWCKISGELRDIDPFTDGFSRAWFLLPRKIKSAFSFIIMRTKKPLSIYGFSIYAMNLATFFEILKLAYQFFAFMVQITNKRN